jgi:hypothetical protein
MKVLTVPYFAQNDNELWGGRPGNVQCCPTSNAMLAFFMKPDRLLESKNKGFVEPESYYKSLMADCGYGASERGNHDAHTVVLDKAFGLKTRWYTDLTPNDFKESIDQGFPVVFGMEYKVAGHIAIAVGYNDTGLIINDPYGIRLGSSDQYQEINEGYGSTVGEHDGYSWQLLDRVVFVGGGWGRLAV